MFSLKKSVEIQRHCKTVEEAVEKFEQSCNMCGNDPRCQWHDCDHCQLAMEHETMLVVIELMSKYRQKEGLR